MKRLYFGRKLKDHNLLQAITRVNRPYKENHYGYVIDFANIKRNFEETNEAYLKELNRFNDPNEVGAGNETDTFKQVIEDPAELIKQMQEIKGSELMTQRNNEALKYFITNVLDDKHFFICNYDKIFYLSTLISVYIFGVPFQQQETLTFYMMASALAGEKEELFLHYCSAVCENTDNSKKEFLEYLISFPYEKLDRNDYNLYIAFAKLMLENKDYGEFPLTYEAYSCKNTVNFVNMTALGEMLLSLKHLHGVDMSKTEIYHDNLMGYEEEYNQSFEDNKIHINFVDSKENELVQLADNISSIYRKCFEKSFEAFRCNKQWTDNIWFTENYSRIINTIGMEHIKMDTQISDYVLPFVIRDIFGNEYGQFEKHKEKFWGLFYFYKEKIMEDIDRMNVELPL